MEIRGRPMKTKKTVFSLLALAVLATTLVSVLAVVIGNKSQPAQAVNTITLNTKIAHALAAYGPTNDGIYAIDPQKGKATWLYPIDKKTTRLSYDSLKITNGIAYFITKERGAGPEGSPGGKQTLVAVKVGQQKPLWQIKLDDMVYITSVLDGRTLYVSTTTEMAIGPGRIYAIDLNKGVVRWKISTEFTAEIGAVQNDALYLAENSKLRAISTTNGSELWSVTNTGDSNSVPQLVEQTVYTFACSQAQANGPCSLQAYKIDSNKSHYVQRKWSTPTKIVGPFTVADNVIYVHQANSQTVAALDARQAGKLLWKYQYKVKYPNYPSFGTKPLVAGKTVYLGVGDRNGAEVRILALHTTDGSLQWDKSIGKTISQQLVTKDNALYYRTAAGTLQIRRLSDGSLVKEIAFDSTPELDSPDLTILIKEI